MMEKVRPKSSRRRLFHRLRGCSPEVKISLRERRMPSDRGANRGLCAARGSGRSRGCWRPGALPIPGRAPLALRVVVLSWGDSDRQLCRARARTGAAGRRRPSAMPGHPISACAHQPGTPLQRFVGVCSPSCARWKGCAGEIAAPGRVPPNAVMLRKGGDPVAGVMERSGRAGTRGVPSQCRA